MKIFVINAGSSSLKYQLIDMETEKVMAKGLCERIGIEGSKLTHKNPAKDLEVKIEKPMENHTDAIKMVLDALTDGKHGVISSLSEISAVGHRVVHGGETFSKSTLITEEVKKAIEDCSEFAPLHNPANLIGINAIEQAMGKDIPQVAVFDTAFHQTMPKEAFMYGLPYEYYEKDKIRRYGFHGTSHRFVSAEAAKVLGKPIEELNIITVHLGNGSSVAAVKGGKCIDTSMGFTPLAGMLMGTRCGCIDPAIIPVLMNKYNLSADDINNIMNKKSGVAGISGVSSDFRDLDKAAAEGNERARLALDMFMYQTKAYVASYAAALGGVDAIVFTAGVGENSPEVREGVVKGMEFMGIKMDTEKNKVRGTVDVTAADSKTKILVIPTNEELMIAKDTAELVK
ncbi:MAG: acetate kinase [Ruminococcaceae bacterium]|jgi:acetate kinase|nr:acetate kinase [Oscillospiraceae bacterium]